MILIMIQVSSIEGLLLDGAGVPCSPNIRNQESLCSIAEAEVVHVWSKERVDNIQPAFFEPKGLADSGLDIPTDTAMTMCKS